MDDSNSIEANHSNVAGSIVGGSVGGNVVGGPTFQASASAGPNDSGSYWANHPVALTVGAFAVAASLVALGIALALM